MRRLLALIAAAVLVASLAGSSAAAGPTQRVNHVVADFTMLDDQGNAVGTVVANFSEPSQSRVVPGTVDVYWAPYDVANPPFPFMALDWPPVRESHAQLLASGFNTEDGPQGHVTVGGAQGYLCDYTAPWNAGCRPFWVQFRVYADGSRIVSWGAALDVTGNPNDTGAWFAVGPGSFVLTFAGPTGS